MTRRMPWCVTSVRRRSPHGEVLTGRHLAGSLRGVVTAGPGLGHPRPVVAVALTHLRGQGRNRFFPGGLGHVQARVVRRGAANPEPRPVLRWNIHWPQHGPVLHPDFEPACRTAQADIQVSEAVADGQPSPGLDRGPGGLVDLTRIDVCQVVRYMVGPEDRMCGQVAPGAPPSRPARRSHPTSTAVHQATRCARRPWASAPGALR